MGKDFFSVSTSDLKSFVNNSEQQVDLEESYLQIKELHRVTQIIFKKLHKILVEFDILLKKNYMKSFYVELLLSETLNIIDFLDKLKRYFNCEYTEEFNIIIPDKFACLSKEFNLLNQNRIININRAKSMIESILTEKFELPVDEIPLNLVPKKASLL